MGISREEKFLKFLKYFILGSLCISLIPILKIAFYNHSSADDYNYGQMTRQAWVATGSFFEVLKNAFRS